MGIEQVLIVLERWGILGFAAIILVFAGWLIKYTLDQNARRESEHTKFISSEMAKLTLSVTGHDAWEQVILAEVKEKLRVSHDEHERLLAALMLLEAQPGRR